MAVLANAWGLYHYRLWRVADGVAIRVVLGFCLVFKIYRIARHSLCYALGRIHCVSVCTGKGTRLLAEPYVGRAHACSFSYVRLGCLSRHRSGPAVVRPLL